MAYHIPRPLSHWCFSEIVYRKFGKSCTKYHTKKTKATTFHRRWVRYPHVPPSMVPQDLPISNLQTFLDALRALVHTQCERTYPFLFLHRGSFASGDQLAIGG